MTEDYNIRENNDCSPDDAEDLGFWFDNWILEHRDDPEVADFLKYLWDSSIPRTSRLEDILGFMRIHNVLGFKSDSTKRKRIAWRRISACIGVAAALVLFFIAGYHIASNKTQTEHETTIITAKRNFGRFTLPDGSSVWLNGESSLTYNEDMFGRSRSVSLKGEAFFEVNKDPLHPFCVEMNDLVIEVLGTSFDVRGYDFASAESVVLETGSVKISGSRLPHEVLLEPNEKFSIDKSTGEMQIEKICAYNYCQWFSPKLVFDNTPFEDILINLERRYGVEISTSERIPMDRRLSIVICNEPLDEILGVLCSLMQLRYRINDDHVAIL